MTDLSTQARRILPLLDLTGLGDASTPADVAALCGKARTEHGDVAAVCIWPRYVAQARANLHGSEILVATVANFPHGRDDPAAATSETASAFADGADEVDVVIPWRALMDGRDDCVRDLVEACRTRTPDGKCLKTILETGALKDSELIRRACHLALAAGSDFLKTSTGKVEVSATPEAAEIVLQEINLCGRPVGFKASGGIRTVPDAARYLAIADRIMGPAWATPVTFRFGASGLLTDVLAQIDGTRDAVPPSGY